MYYSVQNYNHRHKVSFENYDNEEFKCLPVDRCPKLADIVAAFKQGAPIDANLERHLDFNELENNPVLAKGVDLADLDRIAKQVKLSKDQVQAELDAAKLAKAAETAAAAASAEPPVGVPVE